MATLRWKGFRFSALTCPEGVLDGVDSDAAARSLVDSCMA
jgi:hypothetical protein